MLRRLLSTEPEHVRALCLLAVAEMELGDVSAAQRTVGDALALAPDAAYTHYLHATILLRARQATAAAAAARESIRLAPQSWAAHSVLARALVLLPRNLRQAEAAADRAVELAPDEPDAHLAVATVALTARRLGKAVQAVQRALAIAPNDPRLLDALSEMHLQRGRPVAALNVAGALARGHPTAERLRHRLIQSSWLLTVLPNLYLGFLLIFGIGLVSETTGPDVSPVLPPSASFGVRIGYTAGVLGIGMAVGWWIWHRLTPAARGILRWRLLSVAGLIGLFGTAVAATGVVLVASADRTGDADLIGGLMALSWLAFSAGIVAALVTAKRDDVRDAGGRPNSGTVRWALAVSVLNLTAIEFGDRHETPSMPARVAWAVGLVAVAFAVTLWVTRRLNRRTALAGWPGAVAIGLAGFAVLAPAWLPLTAEYGFAPQLFGVLGGWSAVVLIGVRSAFGRRANAGPGSAGA